MLFNSIEFMLFFPIVILAYYIMPHKVKQLWLLIISYYFYMSWNAKYALLMLFSTIITFASGLALEKAKDVFLKKSIVGICIFMNIGILFAFKYINFVLELAQKVLTVFRIHMNVPMFDIILPVGISFYTFQALSYTLDVYRGETYAEKNFLRYALFVSFFPQLVAGPIERSKNLLKQLNTLKFPSFQMIQEGVLLMIWGYFLKMVIADRISLFVDNVYLNYKALPGCYLLIATIFFAIQIYCDFYGYSTIAMGAAKMLGVNLMENFDAPYLATSTDEFWRRWHISLTSWFKDYLYIPLGGSRCGVVKREINRMIVFLVSGLWHGAALTYLVWGGINGFYQVIGEIIKPIKRKWEAFWKFIKVPELGRLIRMISTFLLIDFTWIFFRANSLMHAFEIIKSILTSNNFNVLFDGSLYKCGLDLKNFYLLIISIAILLFADVCKSRKIVIRNVIIKQHYVIKSVFVIITVCAVLLFGKWGPKFDNASFIYFQF